MRRAKECRVEMCERPAHARGLCAMHYTRARVAWRQANPDKEWDGSLVPSNPWAGEVFCEWCQSSDWTMPFGLREGAWRCVKCHRWTRQHPLQFG